MELKLVEASKMKSLEEYLFALVMGMISIKTLMSFHDKAVNLGLLQEDQSCRANTIVWDFRRLYKLYQDQSESVMELLPDDFNLDSVVAKLTEHERIAARKLIKNK